MKASVPTTAGYLWRWLLAIAITLGFFLVAASLLDVGQSAKSLANIPAVAWIAVVFLSFLMAVLRAYRVVASARTEAVLPVFKASFLHAAANALLPARMGEAVLPLALSRLTRLDFFKALGLLLIVRLGDLIALAGLGLILIAFIDLWGLEHGLRIMVAICGISFIAAIAAVPVLVEIAGGFSPRFFRTVASRISAAGSEINLSDKVYLALLTVAIWLILGVASYISIRAAGLEVDFAVAWLACIAASFAFALPVNGIASVGPFEAAFVSVLVLSGADAQAALTAALHLHICALLAAGLAALSTFMFKALLITQDELG